jgi:hypothetical protein
MESSSCSTSDRGRVTLVMVTVAVLLETEVAVFRTETTYHHKNNTTSVTSRVGITYHHKSNTTSVTSRAGTTYHHKSNVLLL